MVWEQGYEHAVHQSADLKQLLELEELLTAAKQSIADAKQLSKPDPTNSVKSSETFNNHTMSSIAYEPSGDSRETESKQNHISSNGNHDKQQNGTYKSDLSSKISLTPGKSSDKSDMNSESSSNDKGNKKFSVTRISKAKSINVDFRLSRGIAQVSYISIFLSLFCLNAILLKGILLL